MTFSIKWLWRTRT